MNGTRMGIEKLSPELFSEASILTTAHWDECACWKDKIKLNVDEEKYLLMEARGGADCYTLRDNGKLVGYMIILSSTHLHYKDSIFSSVDVLFIHPDYRNGLYAIRFMKYVEKAVKDKGASVMTYHIKTFHDYPAIFERLGFVGVETIYAKNLKE